WRRKVVSMSSIEIVTGTTLNRCTRSIEALWKSTVEQSPLDGTGSRRSPATPLPSKDSPQSQMKTFTTTARVPVDGSTRPYRPMNVRISAAITLYETPDRIVSTQSPVFEEPTESGHAGTVSYGGPAALRQLTREAVNSSGSSSGPSPSNGDPVHDALFHRVPRDRLPREPQPNQFGRAQ